LFGFSLGLVIFAAFLVLFSINVAVFGLSAKVGASEFVAEKKKKVKKFVLLLLLVNWLLPKPI
jgi:hypothetical protein